jgi:Mce-associated membrane protein
VTVDLSITNQTDGNDVDSAEQPAREHHSHTPDEAGMNGEITATQPGTHRLPVSIPVRRQLLIFGLLAVLLLGSLVCCLGWRDSQSDRTIAQRAAFLQAGRQGALNLTTINWQHADADTQRILDSATGAFRDDFARRSQPFVELLKKTQSTSVGTITVSGVESMSKDDAQILVAVSVKMSTGVPGEENPRAWRMRLSVRQVGDDIKISNVEFVP